MRLLDIFFLTDFAWLRIIKSMSYAQVITNQISLYAARPASCLIRVTHALGAAASFREVRK